jgi:hypothetical protein
MWQESVKGKLAEYSFIVDRIDGKVKDKVELSGPNGGPIQTEDIKHLSDDEIERIIIRGRASGGIEGTTPGT